MRTLLLVGLTGALGWVARGASNGTPAATAAPLAMTPSARIATVTLPARAPDAIAVAAPATDGEPAAEVEHAAEPELVAETELVAESEGEDLGALIAQAQQRSAELALTHNAIVGQVTDTHTGEELAGVTVIVSGPQLVGAQTAITDEHGAYRVTSLPSGSYLVTFYYGELTVEHGNVTVSSLDVTPLLERLDPASIRSQPVVITMDEGVTFSGDYVRNIPVARTFESVLGDADGTLSFSSTDGVDNTYLVDGIVVPE